MASAGTLIFELAADVSRLRSDMGKAQNEIKASLDSISKSTATSALMMGVDFARSFAQGFAQSISAAIDQADAMGKLAQRIGTTTEALSALNHAASFAAVNLDDLTTGFKGMEKSLLEARDPLSDQAAAYKAFGLNVQELKAMDPAAAFESIADAVSKYADGAQKAGALQQIFGKQFSVLIPMLNEGKEGLEAAKQEAFDLGLVISTSTAQSMGDLNDDFARIKNVSTGLAAQVADQLVPSLQALTGIFKDAMKAGSGLNEVIKWVGEQASLTVIDFMQLVGEIGIAVKVFQAFGASAKQLMSGEFKASVDTMKQSFADTSKAMADLNQKTDYARTQAKLRKEANQDEASAWGQVRLEADKTGKAVANYTDNLDRNAAAHKKAKKEVDEYGNMLKTLQEQLRAAQANGDQMKMLLSDPTFQKFTATEQEKLKATLQATLNQTAANEDAKRVQDELNKARDDADKNYIKQVEDLKSFASAQQDMIDPTRAYIAAITKLEEAKKAQLLTDREVTQAQQVYAQRMEEAIKKTDPLKDQLKDLQQAVEGFGKKSSDAMVDFMFSTKDVSVSFSEMVTSMLKDIAKLLIYKNVMEPLVKGLSGGGATGWVGALTGALGYGGAKMAGGPVSPGQWYSVNESPFRSEAFVPNVPGTIISDAGSMGGPNVKVEVHVHKDSETEDTTGDQAKAIELGKRISSVVRQVIATEKRSGGLLAS